MSANLKIAVTGLLVLAGVFIVPDFAIAKRRSNLQPKIPDDVRGSLPQDPPLVAFLASALGLQFQFAEKTSFTCRSFSWRT